MGLKDLESLAARVEAAVDDLVAVRDRNGHLEREKGELEQRVAALEKERKKGQKEAKRLADLSAENKAYKKKCALLKAKITSMLAKVEVLQ
jgi:predicted  nucleic acid-binding Zn-ribbon protein